MHARNHDLRLCVYAFVYISPKAGTRASASYAMHSGPLAHVMLMRARVRTREASNESIHMMHARSWHLKASVLADIHAYALPRPT